MSVVVSLSAHQQIISLSLGQGLSAHSKLGHFLGKLQWNDKMAQLIADDDMFKGKCCFRNVIAFFAQFLCQKVTLNADFRCNIEVMTSKRVEKLG